MKPFILILSVFILTLSNPSHACTSFQLTSDQGTSIVAKNYDWWVFHDHGLVMTNARGLKKTGLVLKHKKTPASWTSKYGSLTFNQFGKEFPVGGINEKGLVIEILQLSSTKHIPDTDPRDYLNESQWIQYQLDLYESTDEVIKNIDQIRIYQEFTGVHYLICDAQKKCATVEVLSEDFVVHHGNTLTHPALTNSTYREANDYFQEVEAGSKKADTEHSLHRFYRAAKETEKKISQTDIISNAFLTLENVKLSLHKPTQWSIVYEPQSLKVHFKTNFKDKLKTIDFHDFQYDCTDTMMVLDIENSNTGNMKPYFFQYSEKINTKWINKNFILMPKWMRKATQKYPASQTSCTL